MKQQPTILSRFPKVRKELSPEFQQIYSMHYLRNREGQTKTTSLSMRLESWLHKAVAADVANSSHDIPTLEIGAGTLNQMPFEPNIVSYDIVEPFVTLFENSKHRNRVRNVFNDISEIKGQKYQRITSVAVFEHIMNLPDVVAMAAKLLDQNGVMRVSIPNEGTFLWRWGTYITGYEFKKMYGLDYQILMKYEHVNTADEIEDVLKYFFKTTRVRFFGIHKKAAFYRFIECREPDLERVAEYLTSRRIFSSSFGV